MNRDSLLKIAQLSATDVTLVTDEVVCQQAATAYDQLLAPNGPATARSVVVVRLASDYLVVDPAVKRGHYGVGVVLTQQFIRKSTGTFTM